MALGAHRHRRRGPQHPQGGKRARLVESSASSSSSHYTDTDSDGEDHEVLIVSPRRRQGFRKVSPATGARVGALRNRRILTPKTSNKTMMLPRTHHANHTSKSLLRNTRLHLQTEPSVPGASRDMMPLPTHARTPVRTRRTFRVHNDSHRRSSAFLSRPPTRTLRKRKAIELDSTETDSESDLEQEQEPHRQPSNVIDLTTTDEEEMVTADEGHGLSEMDSDTDDAQEEDPDSEYYLHYATSSQLNKLRKPTLVQLLNQLKIDYPTSFDPEDQHQDVELEEMSKQSLLSSLLTAREHQAALSSSPPSSSEVTLNTPKKTATGMSRSTSLPTLPDATPGTTRKAQQQKAPRRVARSISFNDTAEVHVPQHTLRNGKVVQLTALPEEPDSPPHQPVPGPSRLTRSTSRLAQLSAEDHNEEDDDPPTPVAHRTRRTARSSAGSSNDSAGRTLRNGKTVALNQSAEPRESESEGDPIEEQEDDSDQEERGFVDVTTASSNSLLRLRRAELEQLCLDRQLDCDGTKKDMVSSLLAWRRSFTHSASPLSEVGCNWESVRQTNSSGDETEHESPPNTVVRPLHVRTKGQTGARRETKTQALAQIDDFVPDNPALPPLLLDPRRPKRQSRPEATPVSDDDEELDFGNNTPGNRQHRQNDVEKSSKEEEETSIALDLEKLKLQDKAIAPDSIVKAEKIGSGGFKDVYKGTYRKIKVAICDIRGHMSDNEIKELSLLRDLKHDNIVKLVGVVSYDSPSDIPCSLVTELCLNGDLFDFIRRDAPTPSFDKILKVMLDIANGLDYLHNCKPKIIHRDMKSSNVLITARGVAKITDFGLARVKNTARSMIQSLVGTVNWQAPELWVAHPRYNEKVDCYAAGLVFWECLQWHQPVKKYPFEGMNEHAIYQEVGQKQLRPSTASMGRHWGLEILELVDRLWSQSPADRPSMRDAIEELTALRSQWRAANR